MKHHSIFWRAVVCLLIFSSLAYCSEEQTATDSTVAANNRPVKIVCLGDDWTAGSGLDPDQAYPALLSKELEGQVENTYTVVNAGITGETIAQTGERLAWIMQQRIDVFVFTLGLNDVLAGRTEQQQLTDLQILLKQLRAAYPNAAVYLVPSLAAPSVPSAWRTLVDDYEVVLVDSFPEFTTEPSHWQNGRPYPSASGQARVAKQIQAFVQTH